MLRGHPRAPATLALVVPLLLLCGCGGGGPAATSPEEAYMRLLDACDTGDAARLFDALDTRTQWSVETVHKAQREMRQLVLESYPPSERDRALARLPAPCEEPLERPRRYFRGLPDGSAVLADVKKRMYAGTGQPIGSVRVREGTADVWRTGGSLFHFARDQRGRWGWSELREPWARTAERALHEVETVRKNAALYRRLPPGNGSG